MQSRKITVLLDGSVYQKSTFFQTLRNSHNLNQGYSPSVFHISINGYTLSMDMMDNEKCYKAEYINNADVLIAFTKKEKFEFSAKWLCINYNNTKFTTDGFLAEIVNTFKDKDTRAKNLEEKSQLFLSICNDEKSTPSCLPVDLRYVITSMFFASVKKDQVKLFSDLVEKTKDQPTPVTRHFCHV